MQVAAKCIMDAWDSVNCIPYKPGQGPLPDGLYEIERSGPLAALKTPRGKYVFEFDRNAGPDDKAHDYSCKKDGCGRKFKSLAELGSHTRADHKDEAEASDEPVVVAKDGRGKRKGGFTCKDCGEVVANLHLLKVHKKTKHAVVAELAAA